MNSTDVTIPSAFVPFTYLNDPETEDLVYGEELRDGMVVLVEDTIIRANPDHLETRSSYDRNRILETARWCKVTKLRFTPLYDQHGVSGKLVKFIAVYADGTQMSRKYNTEYSWYVKRASM